MFTLDLARAHIRELQRAADDHRRNHPAARAPAPSAHRAAAADRAAVRRGPPARAGGRRRRLAVEGCPFMLKVLLYLLPIALAIYALVDLVQTARRTRSRGCRSSPGSS